ncbi:MAG: GNAT family N-acetyltransferase [Pseudomonadales bacterium]|nr:GNAT family N-acetyltransferase [Pseudomonadales bacterium]
MTELKASRMVIGDIPQIAAWNIQLHLDEGSTPLTIAEAESRYESWIENDEYSGLVFCLNDVACGYILYEYNEAGNDVRSPAYYYVRQFYIDKNCRRTGTGTKAFNMFKEMCVLTGTKINLEANISNPNGQKFWESLGFKACEIAYELK